MRVGFHQDRTARRMGVRNRGRLTDSSGTLYLRPDHGHAATFEGEMLPRSETVFDKFHVLQHAAAALDDVRR